MREYRYTHSEFELRGTPGSGARLEGYAAVFNAEAIIAGLFRESVNARAFNKSLRNGDVRALFNHDPNLVLGRTKAGTLQLEADDRGLRYEVDLPDTQTARDLWTSIERGDVSQSSFAFEVVREAWDERDSDLPLRRLMEVHLYDVSPVTYPAYEMTEVQARSVLRSWDDRAAVPFGDLPVAERGGGWDAAAARARVQAWAGGDDWDPDRYRRAFLWYDDEAPDLLSSYKLPFADVRDGALRAIPEGIYASAQRLGQTDIPDADRDTVRRVLARYYAKMGEEPPWNRATTRAPEDAPQVTPDTTPPDQHSASTQEPEPPKGYPILIARLALLERLG